MIVSVNGMTAMPEDIDRSVNHQDEPDGPSELIEPLNKFKELKNFWRTRNAILAVEPIFDYGKQKLEQQGYLGPWRFNLLQSTISGLPAVIIPMGVHVVKRVAGITVAEEATTDDTFTEILQSFALPFILMLTAYVVGRASLWKPDSTKQARSRAARVFLYLDGAYGLYPQLVATAAFAVFFLNPDIPQARSIIFYVGLWQMIVSMKTIPTQLFHVVGYADAERVLSPGIPLTLFPPEQKEKSDIILSRRDPPLWKYRFCVLVVVPVIAISVSIAMGLLALALRPLSRLLMG